MANNDQPDLDLNTVIPLLQAKQTNDRAGAVQDEQQGLQQKTAAEMAAAKLARGAKPPGGRQDSGAADVIARSLVPGIGPAMDLAGGRYGQAATGAALSAMPYGGAYIPNILKKVGLGAGAAALGLSPTGAGEAEAAGGKGSPPPQQPPPSANVAPQSEEEKEIAELDRQQKEAVEVGRHSKQAGDMAAAQERFDKQKQEVRDRYRGQREFSQWQEGIKKDPSFQGLPQSMQNDVLRSKTMDEGNAALSAAKAKVTPVAQRNPDLIRNLEFGGAAATALIPGLHNAYDRWALNRAANKAANLAGKEGGDIAAGRLKALANAKPNEIGRYIEHTLGGATAPYLSGTVGPSLIDTFTLPHESQGYKQSAEKLNLFDPTNPAFYGPIQRSLLESAVGTGAGTYLGRNLARPDIARLGAKGTLNTLEQRAAAKAAAEAPKVAPPPESTWTTPKLTPLYGKAAEGKRRTVETKPGWQTVMEGAPSEEELIKQLKKPKGK